MASATMTVAPSVALGQSQSVRRIAVLSPARPDGPFQVMLRDQLRRQGYEEGRNIAIDWRLTVGKTEQLPQLAGEIINLNPELIIAHNNESVSALRPLTKTIAIVMYTVIHPVENGFVESLARPGGNITGAAWGGEEQVGKALEVLREATPTARRIAWLANPSIKFGDLWVAEGERAASRFGMALQRFDVGRLEDVGPALQRVNEAKPEALLLTPESVLHQRSTEIASFTLEQKLVSISTTSRHVDVGGLFYYGPDWRAVNQRAVGMVDRILRGTKPADLPVELPSKYELVVNVKTARSIGYRVPQSLLARADRVIE